MIEIGKNLKYSIFIFKEIDDSVISIIDKSETIHRIDIKEFKSIDIIGVKNNSGYCGTMDWGMKNPTFILPTNFFYNIINIFKRKKDTVHIKITLKNGKEFVIQGTQDLFTRLRRMQNNG